MPKSNDAGSDAVEASPRTAEAAEEMRNARRDNSPDPTPEQKADFPVLSTGEAVWVTNLNGGVHDVPGDWVTEDGVGVVRVRGNTGYRYASDKEISEARKAQGLEGSDPKATDGSATANAERFEVAPDEGGAQKPQTATLGHATVSAEAKGAKAS